MAEALKRIYDLAVLKVTLLPGRISASDSSSASLSKELPDSPPKRSSASVSKELAARVQFVLQERDGNEVVDSPKFEVAAREMGVPRRLDWNSIRERGHYPFRLPPSLLDWLRARIEENALRNRVVWLHLVKPYGYLGMFPWESLLKPVLPCPILRLPDFVIDPPQQTPSVMDVALCCRLGDAEDVSSTVDLIVRTAKALASSGGQRPVRVAVLADGPVCAQLRSSPAVKAIPELSCQEVKPGVADESALTTYVINPLAAASNFIANPIRDWLRKFGGRQSDAPSSSDLLATATDPVTSPWLRAVRKALGNRSVDVVHVIAHSILTLERGALLLDQTDLESEHASSHLVLASEFLAFQAQIGAWAAGFSSVANNFSDMGLRQFADDLAQLRPGPLLYQDAAVDVAGDELRQAYTFLLSAKPALPPSSPAIFTYCEPFRVLDASRPEASLEALSDRYARKDALPQHAGVRAVFQSSDNVPSWVAASERFVDLYKLRLAALSSKSGNGSSEQSNEIRATLQRIQDMVAKVAGPGSGMT